MTTRAFARTAQPSTPSIIPAPAQPRLRIGAVNDPLEREADDMADRVLRMPGPDGETSAAGNQLVSGERTTDVTVIRRCPGGCPTDEEIGPVLRRCPSGGPPSEILLRRASVVRHGLSPPDAGGDRAAVAATETGVITRRGTGVPLASSTRRFFERRLRVDLSAVRIHADDGAGGLAAQVGARAFTVGRDIFFGAREYQPETAPGRWLLAHELAHTVQQSAAPAHSTVRRAPTGDVGLETAGLNHLLGGGTVQLRYYTETPSGAVAFPFIELRHVFTGLEGIIQAPFPQADTWVRYDVDMPGLAPLHRGSAVVVQPTRWTFWVRYSSSVAYEAQADPVTRDMIRHVVVAAQRGTATAESVSEGLAGLLEQQAGWERGRYFRTVMLNNGLDWTVIMNYGNWCGKGGAGPVMDSMDECCRRHDECYGRQGCSIFDNTRRDECDQCDDDAVACWLGAVASDPARYGRPGSIRYPCHRCGATFPNVEDRQRCQQEC